MKHQKHGHNCHGVAVDTFMTMATRARWEEVRDVWPDDWKPPTQDVLRIDTTWEDKRTLDNLNRHERQWEKEYRSLLNRIGPYCRQKT